MQAFCSAQGDHRAAHERNHSLMLESSRVQPSAAGAATIGNPAPCRGRARRRPSHPPELGSKAPDAAHPLATGEVVTLGHPLSSLSHPSKPLGDEILDAPML